MDHATSANSTAVGPGQKLGWTSSPNARGTLDIIWNCLLTLFLCCWSILVVNVPAPASTQWRRIRQKLYLLALTIVAPEITFQIALGQWIAARRSVALFHQHGYTDWTIRHGFYANMGGFHFQPSGWKSFPIDANQLHYLVVNHYIEYPRVSDTHIRDKNKVDGMLRLISLAQALWFVVDVIMRAGQGLTVTALELSTVAFVWIGIWTSLCWKSKPADVEHPDCLKSHVTMDRILCEGGDTATGPYHNTPLDFASRNDWAWSKLWAHGLHVLRRVHLAAPPAERPIPRIQNTCTPPVDGGYYAAFVVVSMTYFSIFIAGWNFAFPTRIECLLWRAASLTALSSALCVIVALKSCCDWYPALKSKLQRARSPPPPDDNDDKSEDHILPVEHEHEHAHSVKNARRAGWFSKLTATLRNNTSMKDPALDNPVVLVLATYFFGIFYSSSRAYMVLGDFLELRSLPPNAYQTVDWSWIWPHF